MALRFVQGQRSYSWTSTATMGAVKIIGRQANLAYFIDLTGAAEVIGCGTETSVQDQTVAAHSRLVFPGQTVDIAQVSESTRKVGQDPGRRHGNALPGQSIVLADNTNRRQVTLAIGTILDAHTLFTENANVQFWFYANSGVRYCIPKAEEP